MNVFFLFAEVLTMGLTEKKDKQKIFLKFKIKKNYKIMNLFFCYEIFKLKRKLH